MEKSVFAGFMSELSSVNFTTCRVMGMSNDVETIIGTSDSLRYAAQIIMSPAILSYLNFIVEYVVGDRCQRQIRYPG